MRVNLPVSQLNYDFPGDELLVSVTNTKGEITHCNPAFVRVSGYTYEELIDQPHNLIRHPDMPAAAFKDMWRTIAHGYPWTALVKNRRKNGDHYWVRANVTPIMEGGRPRGYLSVRTKPRPDEIEAAEALYARMRAEVRLEGQGANSQQVALYFADENQMQLYVNTLREDFQLTSTIEPLKDLKVTLTASKNRTLNYSTNFKYDVPSGGFTNLSPNTTGDYSISTITFGTAFKDKSGSTLSGVFNEFMNNRSVISRRLGARNPNSGGVTAGYANGYDKSSQDVVVLSFLAAYTGKDANSSSLNALPKIPLPNWRLTYSGLTKYGFIADRFSEMSLRHGYRSVYSVNGFNSLLRYEEVDGFASSKDVNGNFLPLYQFAQVSIAEQFAPLVGIDTRLKNNMTLNFEINKTRLLGLSLSNSQLAHLSENNLVFGLGYRTTKFRFPFGLFKQLKMDNNMDFKLDISVRDNKTVIYRADIVEAEVSSGAKNITLRPSVDYVLNQRFNVRLFYDSNITKPYTSQSFNTSFSNFGFSLRATLN